jgi:hypothetical protein
MSNDITGIPPSCFGPPFWAVIHQISIAYPEHVEENDPIKIKVFNFFKSLGDVIPCKDCQDHYRENFPKLNLMSYLDSRKNLSLWAYNIHNIVNRQLKVPEKDIPTFEEVYNKYNSLRTENCSSGTVGVCGAGTLNKMYCKLQFLPKESFTLDTGNYGLVIFLVMIIIFLLFLLYRKNHKR